MVVKWFRVFGDQYIGFWASGILFFVLQEVPYMIMPLFQLENNPIMNMQESSAILNICEKVLGSLCIAIMVFIVRDIPQFSAGTGICKIGFILAVTVLLLNYFGWVLYFRGYQSIAVMMIFMVALPPLYYVCIGLWRGNWILSITGAAFEIVHFIHVYGSLKM